MTDITEAEVEAGAGAISRLLPACGITLMISRATLEAAAKARPASDVSGANKLLDALTAAIGDPVAYASARAAILALLTPGGGNGE